MAADAELRVRARDGDSVVEGWAGGHEGRGGEGASLGELADGAVDAMGEAEVVSVEDEAGGHAVLRIRINTDLHRWTMIETI